MGIDVNKSSAIEIGKAIASKEITSRERPLKSVLRESTK